MRGSGLIFLVLSLSKAIYSTQQTMRKTIISQARDWQSLAMGAQEFKLCLRLTNMYQNYTLGFAVLPGLLLPLDKRRAVRKGKILNVSRFLCLDGSRIVRSNI